MTTTNNLPVIMVLAGPILLAFPHGAKAEAINGVYIGAGVGANFLQSETIKGLQLPNFPSVGSGTSVGFDVGLTALGSVGYGFGNGLRVELEGSYRSNGLSTVGSFGGQTGTEEKYAAMVNVLYDFDLARYGLSWYNMSPYVGVGAGYVHNRWQSVNIRAGGPPGGVLAVINNGNDAFAYQAIAGLAFPLTSVLPGLSLTAEYRFFSQPNDRKYATQLFTPIGGGGPKTKVGDDFNHSLMLGVRYAFNSAPPPPPPAPVPVAAPAPAPSRTYLVFFDWDRADLTDRARQIIADAAQNSTRVQYTRIEVSGHADRTGSAAYNRDLSLRRARNVAGELVRLGVPQAAIDVQGFGDTRPLVPTAEGVREPQNRRVEIVLH